MQIFHQSREARYRSPFGARPCGSRVRLALNVKASPHRPKRIALCYAYGLYQFHYGEKNMTSSLEFAHDYVVELRIPREVGILFYWFKIELEHMTYYYVLNALGDGTGKTVLDDPTLLNQEQLSTHAFRITMYLEDYRAPSWICGNVMYQIFPDRFARDQDWTPERMRSAWDLSERIYHDDWLEDVDFIGKPETGYMACDFYGGSLNGIREHLYQLHDLGIGVIYLNPIFHSRSNHRYDTGDYKTVDPMLGTNEDFARLCEEAKALDIRIVLDGVFSHTGADSLYFNKYKRFPGAEVGAYQQALGEGLSPYYSWYRFSKDKSGLNYESWWGFGDLPAVREEDLGFRDFILGKDGVVQHWLSLGASGFRLDVSDELPDAFLRDLYQTVKAISPDAFVMGEVWEDASSKVSYGQFRDFVLGRTHDTVMGYTFKEAVTRFFKGSIDARTMDYELEAIREHYPPAAYASHMTLLSSHDIPRFITAVQGDPDPGTREKQVMIQLTEMQRETGERKLVMAYLFAMMYPGCPSVYYGDELAMEGYRDPFNRRTYDWENPDRRIRDQLSKMIKLRKQFPVLKTGHYRTVVAERRRLVFMRYLEAGRDLLGQEKDGPRAAYVFINADAERWRPTLVDDVGVLDPLTAAVVIEREVYYFGL